MVTCKVKQCTLSMRLRLRARRNQPAGKRSKVPSTEASNPAANRTGSKILPPHEAFASQAEEGGAEAPAGGGWEQAQRSGLQSSHQRATLLRLPWLLHPESFTAPFALEKVSRLKVQTLFFARSCQTPVEHRRTLVILTLLSLLPKARSLG